MEIWEHGERPKASHKQFYSDFKTIKSFEKNGYHVDYQLNLANRRRIIEVPQFVDEEVKYKNFLTNCIYPDGGCNAINGMIFCSFGHMDWQIPSKKDKKCKQINQ
jgi:hypothetical protein